MNEPKPIIIDVDHQMPGHVIITKKHWHEIMDVLAGTGTKIVYLYNDPIQTYDDTELTEYPGDVGC